MRGPKVASSVPGVPAPVLANSAYLSTLGSSLNSSEFRINFNDLFLLFFLVTYVHGSLCVGIHTCMAVSAKARRGY